ncbi:hypothetical protein ACFWBR_42270 [Streptomyces sp. NPDC060006]|uniref:hypothetical protein n=1 Tax=unclassified Streptomyces TaxID=2593676 RepID=UPI0036D05769
MVSLPPDISADILVDGAWRPVSARTTTPISITRGASSEGSKTQPGQADLALDNRDGALSPRNPNSVLFDKIGRNTGFRAGVYAGTPDLAVAAAGDRATTPDAAALDLTGSMDIRVEVKLDDWNRSVLVELAAKYDPTGDQRSWMLFLSADQRLALRWSVDGTASGLREYTSTAPIPVPLTGRVALRSTLNAATSVVTHYTAETIDGPWTLLAASTSPGATSVHSGTAALQVGDTASAGAFNAPAGRYYAFQLRNGIDGTLVADVDFTAQTLGDTSFTDDAGLTWTLAGNAQITDRKDRMRGEVPAWPPGRDLSGADVWTEISAAGILRRLSGNRPLQSVLRREMTAPSRPTPVEYWPGEDGASARSIGSAVGGRPIRITGAPDMATFDGFACSDKLPVLKTGSSLTAPVRRYPVTGLTQVRWLTYIDNDPEPTGRLVSVWTTGSAARWDFIYGTGGTLQLKGYNDAGTELVDGGVWAATAGGRLLRLSLEFEQDGANIDWKWVTLAVDEADGGFVGGTLAGHTFGQVTRIIFAPDKNLNEVTVGHLALYDEITSIHDLKSELNAWNGEKAGRRIERLCEENRIPVTAVENSLDDTQPMGRQRIDNLVKLLQDCADADRGLLLEQRNALGLTYVPLSQLYNQTPVLTLDFSAGVIGAPFKPTDDDKLTENDVTVKREGGSESRAVLETGRLSVQDPPNGVGLGYDVDPTLNVESDGQTLQLAGWILHVGTYDGMRYTKVTLDLGNPRVFAMIDAILQADVGMILRLTNLPADHGPDDVDLLIRGYSEEIGPQAWKITFNCDPGAPYTVALYNGDRRDTAGSQLAAAIDADDTTAPVLTTLGPLWTTAYPSLTANPGFEEDLTGWSASGGVLDRVTAPLPTPFEGDWAAFFVPDGVAQFPNAGTGQVPVTVGRQYVASGWLRSSTTRSVALNVNWFNGSGTYLDTAANDVPVEAGTWTWFEKVITPVANSVTANLAATVADFPPSTDVLWVHQATLRPAGGTPENFPFHIRAGGEVMTVTAATPALVDTFGRTTTPGWGTPDVGAAWVSTGGAGGDHYTQGSEAAHQLTGVDVARLDLTPVAGTDHDVWADLATAALATGGPQLVSVVARATDDANLYMAQLSISTSQVITLTLRKRVGGVETQLDTFTTSLVHSAFTFYRLRLKVSGSKLKARVWQASGTDAKNWQVSATDTSLTTGSHVGVRSVRQTANSNANLIVSVDNMQLLNPQRFTVERSVNGVIKAHAAGSGVVLAKPAIRAL